MLFYAFPLNAFYGRSRKRSEGFPDRGVLTVVTDKLGLRPSSDCETL
jgi:hypothetical protein